MRKQRGGGEEPCDGQRSRVQGVHEVGQPEETRGPSDAPVKRRETELTGKHERKEREGTRGSAGKKGSEGAREELPQESHSDGSKVCLNGNVRRRSSAPLLRELTPPPSLTLASQAGTRRSQRFPSPEHARLNRLDRLIRARGFKNSPLIEFICFCSQKKDPPLHPAPQERIIWTVLTAATLKETFAG